jgi:predicted MFS family arabinose efflux permease
VTLGYLLMLLAAYTLVPLWGLPPLLASLFVTGLGMGFLGTPLMRRTLEAVAHDDIGAASGVYTTASQMAGALGVALAGPLFATFAASGRGQGWAFAIVMLVITVLSLGLLPTVLPFIRGEQVAR